MTAANALLDIGHAAEQRGDYPVARSAFERGAELGDGICLDRLANMFDEGRGGPPDKKRAMHLYRQSWRRFRCTVAANNLAVLYREKGDHRAMFRWFGRGAAEGDGSQLFQMAKCYLDGQGVRKSEQEALRCLAGAVKSGDIFECDRDQAAELLASMRPRAI